MINSIAEIHAVAKQMDSVRIAVAAAADIDVLTAVNDAKLAGIADAVLVEKIDFQVAVLIGKVSSQRTAYIHPTNIVFEIVIFQ